MHSRIIILDFGSQVTQLIARRIRELNIYCEIHPFNRWHDLPKENIAAIVLSGSPASVREINHPTVDIDSILDSYPVLGICYGAQLVAHYYNGKVLASGHREYGHAELQIVKNDPFWDNIQPGSQIWMSHSDSIVELPSDFELIASTSSIINAAYKKVNSVLPSYFVQFHPEVVHSECGKQIFENFFVRLCGISQDWTAGSYVEETILKIKEMVQQDEVLLGLSGGVDSSVAALLIHKAIGSKLHCFFIDNGLLRKDEFSSVLDNYKGLGLQVHGINASEYFLNSLIGISDPEQKRKTIGKCFIDIFEKEAKAYPTIKWLAQGTIYPDVIESASVYGPASVIKSHHNVGGLPEKLNLKLIEPLRSLFKDEVRRVGLELNLTSTILNRHPFPGPGLGIRILGEITKEKISILQEADSIYIRHLHLSGIYQKIWQAGAILLPIKSVGVMGDERTYEYVLALRAVESLDGMTAQWSKISHELLANISNEIINKVKGINRVVYDISSKPPATIEWE
ncbi:MAG: glutamine-hydrolyzing GMP synthase [Saprospiraceae bacterium]|nr:glutamine-hydrolyzing GMP synthase [Saprospiraceae bacterium]